jgi:antitoxin VapB
MRTVSIFKNGKNQAIRLPKDMEFDGVSKLEIIKDGDSIILRPSKPSWTSLAKQEKADSDFLIERSDIVDDEGRVEW